jgi:predicted solute-binding protein
MNRAIKIAYTPDPDDAFHYFALETGLMPPDVREGLKTLFGKALKRRLIDHMPTLDLVDPVLA